MSWFGFGGDAEPVAVDYEGLACEKDDLQKVLDDKKAALQAELDNDDGWTAVDLSGTPEFAGTTVETKQAGELLSYRTRGYIPSASPEDMLKLYWDPDLEARKKWDTSLLSYKVLQKVNANLEVVMSSYTAGVPLVANRVFVLLRGSEKRDGGVIHYAGMSINHAEAKQDPSDVRGVTAVFYRWTPHEGGTRVEQYLQADPKGSLPAMVVNAFKTKSAEQLVVFRKLFA